MQHVPFAAPFQHTAPVRCNFKRKPVKRLDVAGTTTTEAEDGMTTNQVAEILGEAEGAITITSSEGSTRMTDTMTDATATALETAGATATTTTEAGSSSSPGEGPAGATQEDEVQLIS